MVVNFGGGVVPAPPPPSEEEGAVRAALGRARRDVEVAMEDFAFQRALAAIWELIGHVNRFIDTSAPWALAKDPAKAERLRSVLFTLAEALRCLGILLDPFLPEAARRIRAAVGTGATPPMLSDLEWGKLAPGTRVEKTGALFPRVDVKAAASGAAESAAPAAAGPRISLEDFAKVDLRVAEVLAAEKVAKSKKLLRLTVKLGEEERTVVAGVAEHYAPEALVGRKVIVVANLEPATLMGIQSNGMVLAGSHDGGLALVGLDKDLPSGAKVR
jgi:methionyl-tRNA synthetase